VFATVATNYAGTGTSATNASITLNSNGLAISVAAPGAGAALTVSDNATSGTAGRLAFTNLNGITLSLSTGGGGFHTIVGSHNALTTAMASNRGSDFVQAGAAFNGTNASGTIASGNISVSIGNYITTAAQSDHSHGNPTLALTNLSGTTASASNGLTLSLSAAAPGGGGPAASFYDNLRGYIVGTTTQSRMGSTSHIQPFMLPYDISVSYVRCPITMSVGNTTSIATTNGATGSCSILSSIYAIVYQQNGGASSQSLKLYASGSVGFTQRWSFSANATAGSQWTLSHTVSFENTAGATSYVTHVAASLTNYSFGSLSLTLFTGMKALDIPFATSLAAGNYWMMFGANSTTQHGGSAAAMTNLRISFSNIAVTRANISLGHFGNNTNASIQYMPGCGSFSTNAIGTTASLGYSNISSSASHVFPWFQMHRTT
jgi:hypothetical protein